MQRREKIFVLLLTLMLIFFIGLANIYASSTWCGYHYMSKDMLNRTTSAKENIKVINESLLEKDRAFAVDSLVDYSEYLENEFHLEIRCFIHNKDINDKLYSNFYSQVKSFNEFLKNNRNNLISNNLNETNKFKAYCNSIDRLERNLNKLSANYPIVMTRGAFIDMINPYSKANKIVSEIVSSFD